MWLYDAYIVVKERKSLTDTDSVNRRKKRLTFINNALLRSCISKINTIFLDSAEDLDIVMAMCNLSEYSNK